ncbi:MAG: dipeptidase [bacterium]
MSLIPIFDGHNDTLYHLFLPEKSKGRSFLVESEHGHLDLPRAKKGGLIGGIFAIYTPPPKSAIDQSKPKSTEKTPSGYYSSEPKKPLEYRYAHEFTNSVIEFAYQIEAQSQEKVKIIHNLLELDWNITHDVLAMVLHFEGAAPIKSDLTDLDEFYQKGLRSLGIVWSRPNAFGYGVPFQFPHSPDIGPGLTDAGKNLVAKCNELGIILDLAHLNEQGFWDVAKITKHPIVVSHAGIHTLSPSSRNLTDKQLDAIGESNGIIGIMFQPSYFEFRDDQPTTSKSEVKIKEIVAHIDYAVNRIGIDHVALGSDFDGAEMPAEIKDATGLPKLIDALRENGYADPAIEQIAYNNWLRIINATWKK